MCRCLSQAGLCPEAAQAWRGALAPRVLRPLGDAKEVPGGRWPRFTGVGGSGSPGWAGPLCEARGIPALLLEQDSWTLLIGRKSPVQSS